MSSKRHSILPAIDRSGPKPPVSLSSSLTISENAILQGTHSITMQSESVVHPRCRFESSLGSILVGRRCIIHERAHIGAQPQDPSAAKPGGVTLGDYVMVEVGSIIEAGDTEIGEGTIIQVGSRVGSGAKIGKHCTVSHMSVIAPGEILPDFTVVFSNGTRRTDRRGISDMRKHMIVKQISVLRKMIPSNPDKFK
ncbi:trimeric LpxA-like protein [Stachybotrys elegans]|uniref:Dynactin subunit 6 n=1 Tax=Stachybotrys elegans TaxID=80388 RepID=A0A8K0SKC5_9HYPO|nr:trimeric LpxA-like protein [Stachybotrys elegans]